MVKIFRYMGAVFVFLAAAICFFVPFPRRQKISPVCRVVHADGTVTEMRYSAAYPQVLGLTEGGDIRLSSGVVTGSEALKARISLLESGSLAEIYGTSFAIDPLELAALEAEYADTVFHADGFFVLHGGLKQGSMPAARRAVLFAESPSSFELADLGITFVDLRSGTISAEHLIGTQVEEIKTLSPYAFEGEALYLDTVAGRRLVAGMPKAETLTLEMQYADEGALVPCRNLTSLTMPVPYGENVAALFAYEDEYFVPDTLQSLKLTRGKVDDTLLYGLPVQSLDLCGIAAEDVKATLPFAGLRELHTAKRLTLQGFAVSVLPCGCYRYVRLDSSYQGV